MFGVPAGGGLSGPFGGFGGFAPLGGSSPFAPVGGLGGGSNPFAPRDEGHSETSGDVESSSGEVELDVDFRQAQVKWSESWMNDQDLCDAVALVGPARHRVPFIRAPLAAISKPLKAALYGDELMVSSTLW